MRYIQPLKYDPKKIQELIDKGLSSSEIIKEIGIGGATLNNYSKKGLIKMRTRSEASKLHYQKYPERHKHSEESKEKISRARKKFLSENPDKIPYVLNHKSRGDSYPEKYFAECLKHSAYTKKYRVGLYELDFADIEHLIDLEIDGCQHRLDPRIVEHDLRRNENLIKEGWKIIRVNWSEFKKLKPLDQIKIVNTILEQKVIESKVLTFFGF